MQQPISVWLPAVRAGSGSDVFTQRLAAALTSAGVDARISWLPHAAEMMPGWFERMLPPPGTTVVHANSAYAYAFKRRGIPLIVTEHHYVLDPAFRPFKSTLQHAYQSMLIGPFMRKSYAVADAVTTDSQFTARVLQREAGVEVARVVPLWVDYERFVPSPAPLEAGRPFTLLFVGNTSRRKGADVIPALAKRLGRGFEFRCTAGLRQDSQAAGAANVKLLGRLTEAQLISEYQACDAVFVPSRYEGFGYSALEAMACAKPVVGFRADAVCEVVKEGETALMSDIDDIDGLEAVCRHLAEAPGIVRSLGAAGRIRALELFSETDAVRQYIELYRSVSGGTL